MQGFDFTVKLYEKMLATLQNAGYRFLRYKEFSVGNDRDGKVVILRHDVDAKPRHSLQLALVENRLGITGTYYVRMKKTSFDENVINSLVELGNEIGYHYEDLAVCKGDCSMAWDTFRHHLGLLRNHYNVTTICMHGSPLSRFDNKCLWEKYNYRDAGIFAEMYLDTDFTKVGYLTDTGRGWNRISRIRDKVESNNHLNFKNTFELIGAIQRGELPDQLVITIHPQRWTANRVDWLTEFVGQSVKNLVKMLLRKRGKIYAR
jgi:hypothetical protein